MCLPKTPFRVNRQNSNVDEFYFLKNNTTNLIMGLKTEEDYIGSMDIRLKICRRKRFL